MCDAPGMRGLQYDGEQPPQQHNARLDTIASTGTRPQRGLRVTQSVHGLALQQHAEGTLVGAAWGKCGHLHGTGTQGRGRRVRKLGELMGHTLAILYYMHVVKLRSCGVTNNVSAITRTRTSQGNCFHPARVPGRRAPHTMNALEHSCDTRCYR